VKSKLALVLGVLLVLSFVFAGCATGGGYIRSAQAETVAEAKDSSEDTPVRLQGKIVRRLNDHKYLFSDDTGSITLEINYWIWRGLFIDENDTVEIIGEVDVRGDKKNVHELNVKSIKKLYKDDGK
jgi:uncharacterized protein (TIGR00156 family)